MKVCVCIPCLLLGGSEVATLQMVSSLATGHLVTVVCYYEHNANMVSRYESAGARVMLLDEARGGMGSLLRLAMRLRGIFRGMKPDVVHGVYFAPGVPPLLASRLAGVPHVLATIHAAGNPAVGMKARLMFRFSAFLADCVFCVSEDAERFWFGSVGGKRHRTLENGIDIERFSQASPAMIRGIADDDVVIGIVGRLVKMKGHDVLFQAFASLMQSFPDLKLLIVGDGPERENLELLAELHGIKQSIIWCGRIEPEALPGYYKRMSVLAMPSEWEGFGLTAAEAMAAGVPVAASDVPGLRAVVGDGGKLFPVGDSEGLSRALLTLLMHREEYGKRAARRVRETFSVEKAVIAWQDVYGALN